jgi:hypothetical protein
MRGVRNWTTPVRTYAERRDTAAPSPWVCSPTDCPRRLYRNWRERKASSGDFQDGIVRCDEYGGCHWAMRSDESGLPCTQASAYYHLARGIHFRL